MGNLSVNPFGAESPKGIKTAGAQLHTAGIASANATTIRLAATDGNDAYLGTAAGLTSTSRSTPENTNVANAVAMVLADDPTGEKTLRSPVVLAKFSGPLTCDAEQDFQDIV